MSSPWGLAWGEPESVPEPPKPIDIVPAIKPSAVVLNPDAPVKPTDGFQSFSAAVAYALQEAKDAHPEGRWKGWPWFAQKILGVHPSQLARMRKGHCTLGSLDLVAQTLKWKLTITRGE